MQLFIQLGILDCLTFVYMLCWIGKKRSHIIHQSQFEVGDRVFTDNFTGKSPKWISCKIAEVTGLLFYVVELAEAGPCTDMWILSNKEMALAQLLRICTHLQFLPQNCLLLLKFHHLLHQSPAP